MSFNSLSFVVFFFVVYSLYLVLSRRWQNRLLLFASYVFYGSWDWRFIPLLLFVTWASFFSAIRIEETSQPDRKLRYLKLALLLELCPLGIFKYFNFFTENIVEGLQALGIPASPFPVKVLLPLGISYYTFQAVAYSVDVYRGKLEASRNFEEFALFKSFFPILFCGPIERAKDLLPQLGRNREITFSDLERGLFLVFWGLFKKMYVADNLAPIVDFLFGNHDTLGGPDAWLAAYGFAFQLYCDFSGYTDMARGIARLMGFNLRLNFNLPYFARNPVDFWRSWHMSLSSWFTDYFYEPFFFRVKSVYAALFCTFFLIALWHGASWNFVVLGIYNGLVMCGYVFLRPYLRSITWRFAPALGVLAMFHVTVLGFILFRSQSLVQACDLFRSLLFGSYALTGDTLGRAGLILFLIAPVIVMQVLQLVRKDLFVFLEIPSRIRFAASLAALQLCLLYFLFTTGSGKAGSFIYFEF